MSELQMYFEFSRSSKSLRSSHHQPLDLLSVSPFPKSRLRLRIGRNFWPRLHVSQALNLNFVSIHNLSLIGLHVVNLNYFEQLHGSCLCFKFEKLRYTLKATTDVHLLQSHRIPSQILPSMCAWNCFEPNYLRLQFPLIILNFDPVGCHTKKPLFRRIRRPPICCYSHLSRRCLLRCVKFSHYV